MFVGFQTSLFFMKVIDRREYVLYAITDLKLENYPVRYQLILREPYVYTLTNVKNHMNIRAERRSTVHHSPNKDH